jgi:urocanate hydratase
LLFRKTYNYLIRICTSCDPEDLRKTDKIAEEVLISCKEGAPEAVVHQLEDNIKWIQKAEENKMVVGSQARILYADATARVAIAVELNKHIAAGKITAPIVLSRDHHGKRQ